MFEIKGRNIALRADEKRATFVITLSSGAVWTMGGRACVELTDGCVYYLDEAEVSANERKTGTWRGFSADYKLSCGLILHTLVYIENTRDDLWFVNRLEGDTAGQVKQVYFPSAVDFNGTERGHGYTVLPRMQGTLVPAGEPIKIKDDILYSREAYMPIWGQIRDGSGYLAIFDTPFDAKFTLDGENVNPLFITSLGTMSYPRRLLYRFMEDVDYNDLAYSYREYLEEKGDIVTLEEKCAHNPSIERIIGTPVIHPEGICSIIHPESIYYKPDAPECNDRFRTFDSVGEELAGLKKRGLKRGYLHLDGWGRDGYDHLHPDPFPPHERAGGAEGMKRLADTTAELGYIFGIHDQYRDYYYDAATFDLNNAVRNLDGSYHYETTWYGGPQTLLCATLAEQYVRRNYDEFERLGIKIDAAYLDVFSVVNMDECFDPEHPMTREQCAAARNRCFEILNHRGIIPSSEEMIGCMTKTLTLCHHAPYFTEKLSSNESPSAGIHVPLLNLVYHDCVIIPWFGLKGDRGGCGIPGSDSGWLHALLNGNPVYCPIDATEAQIAEVEEACAYAEKLAKERMVRHELIDGSVRRQRTFWSDGTVVEVDFDTDEYRVYKA